MVSRLVWECDCGYIKHSGEMPEDCPKCFAVGKFEKVPDDMIDEKTNKQILSMYSEEEEYENKKKKKKYKA